MKRMLSTMIMTTCILVTTILNLGIQIPKKLVSNEHDESIAKSLRSIHQYTSFVQCLLRALDSRVARSPPPKHCFGAEPHMQREEAIAIHLHNQYRASRAGFTYAVQLFDS